MDMKTKYYTYQRSRIPIDFSDAPDYIAHYANYKRLHEKYANKPIKQKNWKETLDWFFNLSDFTETSKKCVTKISVNEKIKVIALQMKNTQEIFEQLEHIYEETGWYFFLTGEKLGKSKISEEVDKIPRKYKKEDLLQLFEFGENETLKLRTVSSKKNSNCFLISIGSKGILLDCGIHGNDVFDKLKKTKLLGVFLSHAHADHYKGLISLFKKNPDMFLLCSKTTLDYFVFKHQRNKYYRNENSFCIKEEDPLYKIVQNTITVKSGEILKTKNCQLRFYFSGHIPGGLMFYLRYCDSQFLYTGDFYYYDVYPITGVEKIINTIPKNIDFVLVDGALSMINSKPLDEVIKALQDHLLSQAKKQKKVLISADAASTSIILFMSIDKYFQKLQKNQGFNLRPLIVLDRDCQEYAKILQQRKEDLHPDLINLIENKMNPFMSALVKYVKNIEELRDKLNYSPRIVFILGQNNLSEGLSKHALQIVNDDASNSIYLTGRLDNSDFALELISGNKNYDPNMDIKCLVYNLAHPEDLLTLHADNEQIISLLKKLKPKKVGFFHSNRKNLVYIRQKIWQELKMQTFCVSSEEFEMNL